MWLWHITSMENVRDVDEYLRSFLDPNNVKHTQFIEDVKKQRVTIGKDQAGYKKANDTVDNTRKKQNDKKKNKGKGKENKESKQVQEIAQEKMEKKKTKFVNLYSQEGKSAILFKGRHKCNCEATKHNLINNCLNCGRIVCTQEGSGPCFFCEELVCSQEEQAILSNNSKQSDRLHNKLINHKPNNNALEESIKQRDKLLEYDRDGVQCTKVIDDQNDYYQWNNIWLPAEQRSKLKKLEDEMHQRKHMTRLDRKVNLTFDFMGREVREEKQADDIDEISDDYLQEISESVDEIQGSNICPTIEFNPTYMESEDREMNVQTRTLRTRIPSRTSSIIQDKEYLEMSDPGLCLSMHQPYASLLVSGIKIHEGRTWYSSHRGRLWIAATSKTPNMEEISKIEHAYRVLKDERLRFPETYPTSCLLGCVTVVDVLPQEEYRKRYPEGESDSPYVFICEDFFVLPIKFPIQGKHKIYKLDTKIHHAVQKMLEKCTKNTHDVKK
ncbi:activating signal cointegrator 1 isoform X2 [Ceratina calcarata]|uniref:Activating signal cointegrator 1 isoform X2 n=1 Tax=Ceratina calcarata TaxID=156304 RepID=A0AAJ7S5P1_9HYME|nr:activating signal cointegrator 1 isoform X2 [Ceratina calcarata]